MNLCVPNFETDEDYLIPSWPMKSTMGGDDNIMELLWHNGQVVVQSQTQRSAGYKKTETAGREIRSAVVQDETTPSNLFMQEDEMASWLHCPIDDSPLDRYLYNNDLLYPTPPQSASVTTTAMSSLPPPPPPSVMVPSPRPPIPPLRRVEAESSRPKCSNFSHFSRPNKTKTLEQAPAAKQSTVVESNETPATEPPESRASRVSNRLNLSVADVGCGGSVSGVGVAGTSSVGRETNTCELSVTSSPGTGGSGASASMEPSSQKLPPASDNRKRKGSHTDDTECHSEDMEFDYPDAKKKSRGSSSSKRSRAAEVHNLSERRRRDRINEKMKALQELIPRCNKSDKASMLDEAIEYLKSLQLQVQMMSMGCSMVPMMFPGVQQYMSPMGMGMGMNMDMGINRAMVPYPAILPGSALPNSAVPPTAHLGQRFPVPGFQMPPVVAGPAGSQALNFSAPMMSPFPQNPNQPRVPNFADPYQQYLGLHQTQLPLPQNQTMLPTPAKPSSSKDVKNPEHHPTG